MTLVERNAFPALADFGPNRPHDGAMRLILAGLVVAVGMLGSLVAWAANTMLPSAALTEGVVVVEGNRRPVQNRDGGIVDEVMTSEGALVRKGDPLIRLDVNELQAEVDILASQLDQALATQARFQAEAGGADAVTYPAELTGNTSAQTAGVIRQQNELFAARLDAFRGNAKILNEQIAGLNQQIDNLTARIAETNKQIASAEDELKGFQVLLGKKLVEKSRVAGLQRDLATLTLNRGELEAMMAQANNNIADARLKIEQLQKARREEIATGLTQAEGVIADLRPKVRAAVEREQRAQIVAPIDGYVMNLAVHGSGATLGSGQVALELVPENDSLAVQVKITPRDIEQIHEGQSADLTFAVNKSHYQKSIKGTLKLVSADRKIDEATRQPYYEGVIDVDKKGLADSGLKLLPGMQATAAIVTGERTVLRYFLDPITDLAAVAMRES